MITILFTSLALFLPQQQEKVTIHGPNPALVKLGESSRLTITVEGDSARPHEFRVPPIDGAALQLLSGGTRSNTVVRNGRLQRWRTETIFLEVRPKRIGKITIPAFTFNSGTKLHKVPAKSFEVVRDVTAAERASFRVVPSQKTVYVSEPIRFEIEITIDERLIIAQEQASNGEPYLSVWLTAPWLEGIEGTVSIPGREIANPISLVLNEKALLSSRYDVVDRKGARANRYRFTKSFQATKAGRIELEGMRLKFVVQGARSRQRDIFGLVTRAPSKSYYLTSEPISIEVKPLPSEGRPASYTNAVGSFTLAAEVSKKIVKVGDSLQFTLTILGQGNLEFLDPPELGAIDGFHQLGKKISRDAESVRVTYDLTPLDERIAAVPAVSWSFFDTSPGVERYIELSTEAIPIRVEALAKGEGLSTLSGEDAGSVVAGEDDIFDMKAVDADLVALPQPAATGLTAALLLAPWLLCLATLGFLRSRRRRSADVLGKRAKGAAKNFARVFAETGDAAAALAAYTGDRLGLPAAAVIGSDLRARLIEAGVEAGLAADLQSAIDAGTAARYGGGGTLSKADAIELVKRMDSVSIDMKKVFRGLSGLLLGFLIVGGLAAQQNQGEVSAAEQAYRAGDYEKAAQGFRAASELPGADRRLFYNLGNSLYRQDRFAEALVAYRRARLGMPRDHELQRNIALVRKKLDLGTAEGESFLTSLARLRDQLTTAELLWLCFALHLVAAVSLIFGRRVWRVIGILVLAHALLLTVELLVLSPARLPAAIVIAERIEVTAEPRAGLEAVFKLRQGVSVEVLGESSLWTRVRIAEREGYVPTESLGFIR